MEEGTGLDWADYVAVYGAILATAVAVYSAVSKYSEKRPKVRVDGGSGVREYASGGISEDRVFVSATNVGERAVILSQMGVVLPNNNRYWFPDRDPETAYDVTFPHELRPEHACGAWTDALQLARALESMAFTGRVTLVGFYKDQVGRTYESEPFEFDVDEQLSLLA